MNKLKLIMAVVLVALCHGGLTAQVRDVSVVASPYMQYDWWNQNVALKNTPFYGARLGFGFGPFLELRANVEKSLNLKNALEGKEWVNPDMLAKLKGNNIDIVRAGAELNVNLVHGFWLTPYLNAGVGVQIFDFPKVNKVNDAYEVIRDKNNQLYASVGAGFRLNLTRRIGLSFEAKNVQFHMNESDLYINHPIDQKQKRWGNWAAGAALDIYLGSNPTYKSKRGKAYFNVFSDGFSSPKFVLEPTVAYMAFNKNSGLNNNWFLGGSAGVDFNSLIGVRGFYYQATEVPNKLNFKFNKEMRMYGGNLLARLNYPRGIVPYLKLGAGLLDNKVDEFDATGAMIGKKSQKNLFGLAGAGIEIPVSQWIALYGAADAIIMNNNSTDLTQTKKLADVTTHMMYTAGLRINIGKKGSTPSYEKASVLPVENEEINEMRQAKALSEPAVEKVVEKSEVNEPEKVVVEVVTKQEAPAVVEEQPAPRRTLFGKDEPKAEATRTCPKAEVDYKSKFMTKGEFEAMVNRVAEKIRREEAANTAVTIDPAMNLIMTALGQDAKVASEHSQSVAPTAAPQANIAPEVKTEKDDASTVMLMQAIEKLSEKVDNLEQQRSTRPTIITAPAQNAAAPAVIRPVVAPVYDANGNVVPAGRNMMMRLNKVSFMGGMSFGEATVGNVGLRTHFQVGDSNFDFTPELIVGVGKEKKMAWSFSANMIYNIDIPTFQLMTPYVGAGLGIFDHTNGSKVGTNIILGTTVNVLRSGQLFFDYSARQLFKNNQLSLGYRLLF